MKASSKTISVEKDDKPSEEANPAYDAWLATDQQVLSFLLGTLSPNILVFVIRMHTAAKVWAAIQTMFVAQSRTRIANLRVALARTRYENLTVAQFFNKMKGYADELASAGRPIEEEELVEYLLADLDDTYNRLFATIGVHGASKITSGELYAQIVAYDNHLELLSNGISGGSSVNSDSRGRGGGQRGGDQYGGSVQYSGGGRHGGGRGYERRGQGRRGGGNGNTRHGGSKGGNKKHDIVTCHICGKPGHDAWKCWHRYSDDKEEEEEKGSNSASYGVDTNWYGDTGATDHITSELNKLTMKDKYQGREQIHAANGQGSGNKENSA